MKQYYLKIESKNEKSLKHFLLFLFKHLKTKFNIIQKPSIAKTNRKVITFLKSPHVNKTAQDHFETHLFIKKILVKSSSLRKTIVFSKKVVARLFQDISIKLELFTSNQINKQNNLSLFNLNQSKLSNKNFSETNFKRCKQKVVSKNFISKKSSLTPLIRFLNKVSVFGEILIIF
jgi:ribosomal protein S10